VLCHRLAIDRAFEGVVIIGIVVSSICLAMDSPRLHASDEPNDVVVAYWLKFGDMYVWPWFFGVEFLIKVRRQSDHRTGRDDPTPLTHSTAASAAQRDRHCCRAPPPLPQRAAR
jgi:hypothetical protein